MASPSHCIIVYNVNISLHPVKALKSVQTSMCQAQTAELVISLREHHETLMLTH